MKRPGYPILLLGILFLGCRDGRDDFHVVEVIPAPAGGPLRLNEPVIVVFSEDVDPSSVSRSAVQVAVSGGAVAPGRLETAGARVTFRPRPVAAPALDDGGYPPAGKVELALPGFPARTGVLSARGAPLADSFAAHYDVVDPSSSPPFQDVLQGVPPRRANRLVAEGGDVVVAPGGRLHLRFTEPLRPASVGPHTVRLRYDNPDRDPVDTRVTLIQGERDALVVVQPAGGFEAGTHYLLQFVVPGLQDLAGTPFDPEGGARLLRIVVRGDGPEVAGEDP